MRLYVASSWRNVDYPLVVNALRRAGHHVYDFRNPVPGNTGFNWKEVDPDSPPPPWEASYTNYMLNRAPADEGFAYDYAAMQEADGCVLVLPSGRSAHVEFGWMVGAGKHGWVYQPHREPPELMYRVAGNVPLESDVQVLIERISFVERTRGGRSKS